MAASRGVPPALVGSVLVVGIALAVVWLGTRFSVAVDITANARHSLSATSVEAARRLEGPLEAIAVLRPDPATVEALEALLARFREIKPDIALEVVNPDTNPARARDLEAAPGGEIVLRAGGREQRLQNLSERAFASALRRLGREGERDIAFVTGHDERSPLGRGNDDWNALAARLESAGLVARETSLVTEPRVADGVDVLVLAAPRRPYFPGEIASVLDHVRRGGNLLWLSETPTGDTTRADGEGTGGVRTGPGLEALAVELGVETLPGTVIDTASQALAADSPDFVLLERFPAHPVTATLASPVLLPQARALAAVPLAGQTLAPLLRTPESSWTESGVLEGAVRFDEGSDEVAGPLLLGVTIERALATLPGAPAAASVAVDDGSADEGEASGSAGASADDDVRVGGGRDENGDSGDDGEASGTRAAGSATANARAVQRIAVLGDADFAASRFLGNGANAAFAESLLLWLAGDDAALDFVVRAAPDAELTLGSRARVTLGALWLAAVPLALALVGVGVRLARARADRRAEGATDGASD